MLTGVRTVIETILRFRERSAPSEEEVATYIPTRASRRQYRHWKKNTTLIAEVSGKYSSPADPLTLEMGLLVRESRLRGRTSLTRGHVSFRVLVMRDHSNPEVWKSSQT